MREQCHLSVYIVRLLCLFESGFQIIDLHVDDRQFDLEEQACYEFAQLDVILRLGSLVSLGNHVDRHLVDLPVGMELIEILGLEARIFAMLLELIHDGLIDRSRRRDLIAAQGIDDHIADGVYRAVHFDRPFAVPHDELHEVVVVCFQTASLPDRFADRPFL